MKEIKIKINGRTPLLCNRFTESNQQSATNRTSLSTSKENLPPTEQAHNKLYLGEEHGNFSGKPIIPGPNMMRCIIDAGKFFKAGKSKVTTQKSSLIPACVDMNDIEIPIEHEQQWTVDERPVRNPATGGRFLCYRPKFFDWKLEFNVALDTDIIPESLFRDILDAAGKRVGLGDFRPYCKGPFGKFEVISWESKKAA